MDSTIVKQDRKKQREIGGTAGISESHHFRLAVHKIHSTHVYFE